MRFNECIDLAISNGLVKAKKGAEAKKAWQDAWDEARFQGKSERAADDLASLKAVERLGKKTADEKWRKINEIRIAADVSAMFGKTDDPAYELYWLSNKLDATARRIVDEAHTLIENNLEKWRPRAAGTWIPVEGMDQIVRAAYGLNTTAEARKLFEEVWNAHEFLRRRANLEGANMAAPPKKAIPLMQTREKLNRYAHGLPDTDLAVRASKAKAEWVNEHLDGLDWELVTTRDGEEVLEHERTSFLSRLYDSLTTAGDAVREPTSNFSQALAKRLSHPDFFYYKDADTWLKMNEKYGLGDIYKQLISAIHMRSKDISLLEHLGPNPERMINYIDNVAVKRGTELDAGKTFKSDNQRMRFKTREEMSKFEEGYKLFSGQVPDPTTWTASIGGSIRGVLSPLILPMAFISNLGDIGMGKNALMFYKMPATGYMRHLGKSMKNLTSEEGRLFAVRNLGAMESSVSLMLNEARYSGMMDGAYWVKRFNESFFRTTMMTMLTQGERHAGMWHLLGEFGTQRNTAWEKLPWLEFAQKFGITKQDWDTFRKTAMRSPNGEELLHPFDVLKRTDLDPIEARRLADKFYDFALDINQRVAPTVTTRIQVALGESIDPNTARGQVMRSFGYIKQFSAMVFMTYLKDAMGQTGWTRVKSIARFFGILTLAGAFITQAKALLTGKDPEDMNPFSNPTFWIKAGLNGGSFGFAGDVLFGTLGAFQHGGVADLVAGPLPPFIDAVKNLTIDDQVDFLRIWATEGPTAATNKYRGMKDLAGIMSRYNPTPWQFKLLMQRLVLDDVVRNVDPRAYQTLRRQESERANRGQQAWWPVGSKTPTRPPDLGAAVGF